MLSDQKREIAEHEALVQRVGKREFERREGESEIDFSARMARLQAQMNAERKDKGDEDSAEHPLAKAKRVWQ